MIEQLDNVKNTKIASDIFSIVLIVITLGFMIFFAFKFLVQSNISIPVVSQTSVVVDADFINSSAFKSLQYVPDSSVFDTATTGSFASGNANPFSK